MKQRRGLDRNVLRPTPGDPRGAEQHHWNISTKIYHKQGKLFIFKQVCTCIQLFNA